MRPIKALAGGKTEWFECVPDAVAFCRRYFMSGGRDACKVWQDDLIYTIELSSEWNGIGTP